MFKRIDFCVFLICLIIFSHPLMFQVNHNDYDEIKDLLLGIFAHHFLDINMLKFI